MPAHPKGSVIEGPIRNITEFGLFIGLDGGVDGMVHLSDLDWNRSGDEAIKDYKKGDNVKAVVLDVDPQKERISLGIKQVGGDPMESVGKLKKGSQVTCEVLAVQDSGIEVKIADSDMTTFIKRSDLSRDRSEQRPERFNVGDKVDAAIINIDKNSRRISVSIKALEIAEEKQAVAQYGSSDSGASLGRHFQGRDQEEGRRRHRELTRRQDFSGQHKPRPALPRGALCHSTHSGNIDSTIKIARNTRLAAKGETRWTALAHSSWSYQATPGSSPSWACRSP